jgi:polyribonucleotide nucleotidyltransferase
MVFIKLTPYPTSQLELRRTITSMTLTEERDILKQINKLQQQKLKSDEFQAYDGKIKEHRAMTSQLRDSLRQQTTVIQELRVEFNTMTTAADLGCHIKDLVGQKVDCPTEKIGPVIGKKGKNIKSIQTEANVAIDVQRKGDIHLIGTKESIGKAVSDINKLIERKEEFIDLNETVKTFLTTAKITALTQLRERHPDVYVNVGRDDNKMVVRGGPLDIEAVKSALTELNIVETTMSLTAREGGILIGKSGTTIGNLVEIHQVVIDVQRVEKSTEESEVATRVKIIGPRSNVDRAKAFIDTMVVDNKDAEELIALDPNVRMALLLSNGAAIQTLRKRVNDTIKALVEETAPQPTSIYVAINIQDDAIGVKTRARILEQAVALVREEVSRMTRSVVKVSIDPFVIPLVIGKGGEGIKQIKEGTTGVNVEIGRDSGEICVCGSIEEEVNKVIAALEKVKAQNLVKRIPVPCDDSDGSSNTFSAQFRNFLRSPAHNEVQELVFMVADDAMKQIVLRGTSGNIEKAGKVVEGFLSKNYFNEICVTEEDLSALLTGGKDSKIVELAEKGRVNLSTDRQRQMLIARGEKENVEASIASVREFLYGGENILVRKIALNDNELKGVVIGKGGKTKNELERKYPNVGINIHQSQAAITIRGPTAEAVDCHVEILKLILGASLSRSVELNNDELKKIQKSNFHRRLGQSLNIQVVLNEEDKVIVFRGSASDIEEAERLLKAETKGVYETGISLGVDTFKLVKAANQNAKHIDHIAEVEKVTISFREPAGEIVFAGDKINVCKAKTALVSFLEFLLGERMARCAADGRVMSLVGRPVELAEIQARSNAHICIDKDLEAILVFSMDEGAVKSAANLLARKIETMGKLVHVIQLDASEGWLLSNVIGKGGAQIKKIRKEAKECKIDVDSKQLQIVVTGTDEETISAGKKALENFIDTSRKECMFVSIPASDLPAFVGRGGSNIRELASKYEVELQIMKNQEGSVRITGPEEKVSAARSAIDAWLAVREAEELAASVEEIKRVRPNQIPTIIGTRGATISALTKEFGCRIDIDRAKGSVMARGGTPENRANLFKKIDQLLSEQATTTSAASENPDTIIVDKEKLAKSETQPAPKRLEKPKAQPIKQTTVSREFLASGDVFPTLPGADGSNKQVAPGMNWPVAKPEHIGDKVRIEEKARAAEGDDVVIVESRDWREQYYGINF